ncbi:MAG TPA: AAA family ATPase [Gallionellaceae bacterium]|nr:AAA family ATPase [Gallionellaceae bacterium]
MYLEHFGLQEPPFKITPVTDFFFSGANRGEILDALIYAISESEGIIKVTGEVGSGKTMLCRMLLEKLPDHIEAVYLANPSLTREEMLYAIADGLNLDLEGKRVNSILQTLQNTLEEKISQGKRVVILVDEAHAMPLDTMEDLRLLYNMQVGNHKLLHIVLFGQPELNDKLSQPNMRQLKDRIVHHFSMLPLSQNIIESYLLFRLRTAGYRGPTLFSSPAATLIGKASQGLMRRVNILADKSMLAAFVENTFNIDVRHVQAAIQDSELGPTGRPDTARSRRIRVIAGIVLLIALVGAATALFFNHYLGQPASPKPAAAPLAAPAPGLNLRIDNAIPVVDNSPLAQDEHNRQDSAASAVMPPPAVLTAAAASEPVAAAPATVADKTPPATARESHATLLQQRLAAGEQLLRMHGKDSTSIQLFYTDEVQPVRMEGFLKRANSLDKLNEIYVLPIKVNGRNGYRVLYGAYPNGEAAREGIRQLPQRYKDAFEPMLFALANAASP